MSHPCSQAMEVAHDARRVIRVEWGHATRIGREKRAGVLKMELAGSMLIAFVAGVFVGVLLMAMLFMARGDDDATMERGAND